MKGEMVSFKSAGKLSVVVEEKKEEFFPKIVNSSENSAQVKEALVLEKNISELGFSENAMVYCEGYQKLTSTYVKLGDISENLGGMDRDHYKLPQTKGFFTGYNYICFSEKGRVLLFGATSCRSYSTEIRINQEKLQLVQITEGREVHANSELSLESYAVIEGTDKNCVMDKFASFLTEHHPTIPFKEVPDGWCSWYCYGPDVTQKDIMENMASAGKKYHGLKYIQIDDGYQPHMGDWLLQTKKFPSKMKDLCLKIRESGFEPAMWVAPFIASEKSELLRNHPDWFIKDESGKPLCTADVTFRGWRDAPWYFLDPTHPEAIEYLKHVFRVMKNEWKVNYFKLDANAWGALPFGVRFKKDVTSVEAYRIGMAAIWEACGPDTYLLGCNAPLWPSVGAVNGMRVTADVERNIKTVKSLASQCFHRNWMHNRLWINDPDCLVQEDIATGLRAKIPFLRNVKRNPKHDPMYRYAAAFVRASGGMVLSGDKLFSLNDYDDKIIDKILSAPRKAAEFNEDFSVGITDTENSREYFLFNSTDKPKTFTLPVTGQILNQFTDEIVSSDGKYNVTVGANDALWLKVKKDK